MKKFSIQALDTDSSVCMAMAVICYSDTIALKKLMQIDSASHADHLYIYVLYRISDVSF